MRILVADDDAVHRRLLESHLTKWRHEVVTTDNGAEALEILQAQHAPQLALLDWVMPGMDGPEICGKLHAGPSRPPAYIILVTARDRSEDIVAGLDSGAEDYIAKPFNPEELRARLQVGVRVVELRNLLMARVKELEQALAQVKMLQGLLPICCYCKKIRDDRNYWQEVESYVSSHSRVEFSHGVCPECYEKLVKPQVQNLEPLGK
jgi:DNA-binding response OmpR family regulator